MVSFVRKLAIDAEPEDYQDPTMVRLLDAYTLEASPAWRRIIELIHERGMTGWTDIREAD